MSAGELFFGFSFRCRRSVRDDRQHFIALGQCAYAQVAVPDFVVGDDVLASPSHVLGHTHLPGTNPFDSSNPGNRIFGCAVVNHVLYKFHDAPFPRPTNCPNAPSVAVFAAVLHKMVLCSRVSTRNGALVSTSYTHCYTQGIHLANA